MNELAQQIVNGLSQGATYAVVALGFGLIFSVMGVLNMTHPDIFMVAAYVTYLIGIWTTQMAVSLPVQLILMFAGAVVVCGLLGLVIERGVLRPLRLRDPLIVFIATAAASIILRSTAERVFGPDPVTITSLIPFQVIDLKIATMTINQLIVAVTAFLLMGLALFYVKKTRMGLATRAVAEKPVLSSAFGINVNRVAQATVALSSIMAGIAGVSVGLLFGNALPNMGGIFGVKSFICMLAAGNRHLEGIVIVGLSVGVLEALVTGFISSSYREVISLALLLVILYFRPTGIFGSYPTTERA